MSLLTKTEASQFDSFLETMDYDAYMGKEWQMYSQNHEPDQFHDKSQLTKATKDLMALDYPQYQQPQYYYQQQQQQPQQQHYDYPQQPAYPRPPSFPFLHQQRPSPPSPHPLSIGGPHSHGQYPTPTNSTPSTASTSSSGYSFPPSPVQSRRPSPKTAQPPTASTSKRPRAAPPPAKPALLSASQKKANHIQSEQKRRANIRRGYEALCEAVPALRDAIREEEAAQAARNTQMNEGKGKRSRGRAKSGDETSQDKTDGRAGPRSENVVLSKTIDYLNELIADRESLRTRMDRARAALPLGHPALTPETPDPLWEREWKGGLGDEEDDDEEDDSPP
ncbi:BHLH domain-containing protein [Mycena indigotica]|uniref:BHLH domain-containing protein n=1 Tax=Mycena indigotica TaxID=2126181 RepID=A0A8H6WBC9_9AGAR|nr:BHLH domain-containing protein [Mycena indigotica]KAF7312494.1 BHLH domain-containing protein [Mycena indigotica]